MCLVFIGFYYTCILENCTAEEFHVLERRHLNDICDERSVRYQTSYLDPCRDDACPNHLYRACISQYEGAGHRGYSLGCYICRMSDAVPHDVRSIEPSEDAQRRWPQTERTLVVTDAESHVVEQLLQEELDLESADRGHENPEREQRIVSLRRVLEGLLSDDYNSFVDDYHHTQRDIDALLALRADIRVRMLEIETSFGAMFEDFLWSCRELVDNVDRDLDAHDAESAPPTEVSQAPESSMSGATVSTAGQSTYLS